MSHMSCLVLTMSMWRTVLTVLLFVHFSPAFSSRHDDGGPVPGGRGMQGGAIRQHALHAPGLRPTAHAAPATLRPHPRPAGCCCRRCCRRRCRRHRALHALLPAAPLRHEPGISREQLQLAEQELEHRRPPPQGQEAYRGIGLVTGGPLLPLTSADDRVYDVRWGVDVIWRS